MSVPISYPGEGRLSHKLFTGLGINRQLSLVVVCNTFSSKEG